MQVFPNSLARLLIPFAKEAFLMSPGRSGSVVLLVLSVGFISLVVGHANSNHDPVQTLSTPSANPFSPSNARTEDGKLIPVDEFFSAQRCAGCHHDTHAAWSESLHRNAAREPFYRESVDILLRTRGIEPTRHCESCHTPIALFSGALVKDAPRQVAPFTSLDDEGVTCTVCHSITGARLNGTGSFTIRRPALLAEDDGTPIFGNFTDDEILANIPAHRRAVMRPLLRQPEFCATCHKVDAPAELNGYKHIRGFSAYDEWQQSGASQESVAPYYRSEKRIDCRGCHMPKIESLNDRAAKSGVIASHQWLGANTAAPLFYGQTKQVERTVEFLRSKVVNADIFALKRESTGERFTELTSGSENEIAVASDEEVTAEVVIANRKAAHSFAPEVRDLYEVWVQFEAVADNGEVVLRSGFLKPDHILDEGAHVYKAILLDEQGRPITRHQIWLTNIKGYDNAIPAGRCDIARFRFRLPHDWQAGRRITLTARVNYRRFNQEYIDYVLARQKKTMTLPVVEMAEAQATIVHHKTPKGSAKEDLARDVQGKARRWNDYGIALLEQAQYGSAADAFRRVSELEPQNPDPLISAAIAELKTERYGPEREQLGKAAGLLVAALKLNPTLPRARFYHALVLRSQGHAREAASELEDVARQYPRDREVARQLGQTLYGLGRIADAQAAFQSVSAVDPTDAGAYQFLSIIYASLGLQRESEVAGSLYLQWRDDPLADKIAARFFISHPEWTDERISAHTHGEAAAPRPVLTGRFAAPVR
jgi:Flp pilus assembly protein TadD